MSKQNDVFRVFLHTHSNNKPAEIPGFIRPGERGMVPIRWYEFYSAREADACLAEVAASRTVTKARHRTERLDGVREAFLRSRTLSEYEDGPIIEHAWWFGSVIHVVFPYTKGKPVGFYCASKSVGHGSLSGRMYPFPQRIDLLCYDDMTLVSCETIRSGTVFQFAELTRIG